MVAVAIIMSGNLLRVTSCKLWLAKCSLKGKDTYPTLRGIV